jgi:hypothetical protein
MAFLRLEMGGWAMDFVVFCGDGGIRAKLSS